MKISPAAIRGILLDIEGTTSSITFVHDVMFPFVLGRLHVFLQEHFERPDVQAAVVQIARDAGYDSLDTWQNRTSEQSVQDLVETEVRQLMAKDVKATGMKALQGLIWDTGFRAGQLKSHVYPDVIPAIQRWKTAGIDVRIYSSGSIVAQKLFFAHVAELGDCLHLFSGHYDTTSGGKKEPQSYRNVAADWGLPPESILFVSDIEAELLAADAAGMQTAASIRAGNTPLSNALDCVRVESFDQIPV